MKASSTPNLAEDYFENLLYNQDITIKFWVLGILATRKFWGIDSNDAKVKGDNNNTNVK